MARIKKSQRITRNKTLDVEDFQRKIDDRTKKQNIVIACEDIVSAPTYFKMIVAELISQKIITQNSFVVAKHHNTHPTGVLKDLESYIGANGETYIDFDFKWIVIDRDIERVSGTGHTEEDFNRAISDAKRLEVEVAYANDSFELWYFLHFDYTDSAISRDDVLDKVIQKLKKENPTKFKELNKKAIKTEDMTKLIFEELLEYQNRAIKNATRLLKSHEGKHNPENYNPSTTIHKLVEILNKFCK